MTCDLFVGATVRHTVEFYATDGTTLVDPTNVVLRTRTPDPWGIETHYVYGVDAEIVRDAVGQYHFDALYELPGRHFRRWEASGNINTIKEEWTKVNASAFEFWFDISSTSFAVAGLSLGNPTAAQI